MILNHKEFISVIKIIKFYYQDVYANNNDDFVDKFFITTQGKESIIDYYNNLIFLSTKAEIDDNVVIRNLEFTGARVADLNGAGIRYTSGDGLILIENSYFHDNENGILTSNPYAGDILIEYSEFEANGYGDGFTHNMYIGHVNNFTIRFCYTHHTDVGHNIKSRAENNYILYNRIMDEETGNSSRLIDVPNGGYCMIKGNTMMQGENALNNNCIGYGKEGLVNSPPHELYIVNNTIINKRVASCNYVDVASGTDVAYIINNIFAGEGNELVGSATTYTNNYYTDDISSMLFEDEANYNYRLLVGSPAIDSGETQAAPHIAEYEYLPDLDGSARPVYGSSIDVGAYEFFIDETGLSGSEEDKLLVYPNPTEGVLCFSQDEFAYEVYDLSGKLLLKGVVDSKLDVSELSSGVYLIHLLGENDEFQIRFEKK